MLIKIHLTAAAIILVSCGLIAGQQIEREIDARSTSEVRITNKSGRIKLATASDSDTETARYFLRAVSTERLDEAEIQLRSSGRTIDLRVVPNDKKRIDIELLLPAGINVRVETAAGSITADGDFGNLVALSETGTIAANVPTDNLAYLFEWTESKPRFAADIELPAPKELSAGRSVIKGSTAAEDGKSRKNDKRTRKTLRFSTARGIILLNVPPNEIANDLRERPLTNAAKAIIRSGDSLLMEAIRRAAPRYYGEYARSLPPYISEPRIAARRPAAMIPASEFKKISARVMDAENRSLGDLSANEMEIVENGAAQEIVSVSRSEAPFNLILALDVSGSVDRYMSFIRKAARAFIETAAEKDRIAIVTFAEDVKVLAELTTDRKKLSASLDTFDAGGGTAYYDALAYVISETLRPLAGERAAIVVLTDGDDNRSFLAFDTLLGPIQESGAIIYPLYVPSGVMASADLTESGLDPLRERYLSSVLTEKARKEGPSLASASGGVFYNITQVSDIQKAYDDVVAQLRGSYEITYRSSSPGSEIPLNRIRVRSLRPGSFVQVLNIDAVRPSN